MKFIIYTPLYNENTGGIVVLHKLCQLLNSIGETALVWYDCNPLSVNSLKTFKRKIRYFANIWFNKNKFETPYNLKLATKDDLRDSVVIYPEVIAGNPLNAKNVVRWLLYKPGKHTGVTDYGLNDLFFYFLKEFDDPSWNRNPDNKLYVVDYLSHIYKKRNNEKRSGVCYMVRKGNDRKLNYHPKDALKLDDLSHYEISQAFNKYKYFISYDLYTMYTCFAAICGCIPVVVPKQGVSREEWLHSEESRYGLAYGFDDISWAVLTRSNLLKLISQMDKANHNYVCEFVKKCKKYFNISI